MARFKRAAAYRKDTLQLTLQLIRPVASPEITGLRFQHSINISDLNAAFEKAFIGLPGGSNAFPFGNQFLKGALNSFSLRFRAEQFLRAPDFSFVQDIMFVPSFAVGASHIPLSSILRSVPLYRTK